MLISTLLPSPELQIGSLLSAQVPDCSRKGRAQSGSVNPSSAICYTRLVFLRHQESRVSEPGHC